MNMAIIKCCRACRQPTVLLICVADFLYLLMTHVLNNKWKRFIMLVLVASLTLCWLRTGRDVKLNGYYSPWSPSQMAAAKPPKSKYFVHGASDDIYMYSAIANDRQPLNNDMNVVITSLDASYDSFQCCFILDNKTLYVTMAREHFFYHTFEVSFIAKMMEYFDPGPHRAHQHICSLPETGHFASHVTLTSSICSSDITDYLPILYPPKVPGGIALCAKIAHSGGIDPEKFIEWVEIQRIQGVDKILLFDLGNPDPLNRVFRYYQKLGVLDLQPYELPGLPKDRTLLEKDKHTTQFHHDETLPVLECRQRMGGYTYVLSHDIDEFIIPREDVDLRTFLKEKMETYLDSAGFFFYAEFFISNWGPTDPKEDLMVTRYRKTTLPHWECTKYVYLPSRVLSSVTHDIYPHSQFTTYRLSPKEAVLHHYRQCPDDVWSTCFPETIVDHVMTRFTQKHKLYERVKAVREATNIKPRWMVEG